jgi:type II secretory pathway pseudopilin PulG
VRHERGFTLIEAMITTLILVTGLAAIVAVFTYGTETSIRVRQQTMAFTLLINKMEELKSQTTLDAGHFEQYIGDPPIYRLSWDVSSEEPRGVTVIVLGKIPGFKNYRELARAATLVGPGF